MPLVFCSVSRIWMWTARVSPLRCARALAGLRLPQGLQRFAPHERADRAEQDDVEYVDDRIDLADRGEQDHERRERDAGRARGPRRPLAQQQRQDERHALVAGDGEGVAAREDAYLAEPGRVEQLRVDGDPARFLLAQLDGHPPTLTMTADGVVVVTEAAESQRDALLVRILQ